MTVPDAPDHAEVSRKGYETSDAKLRPLVFLGGGLVLLCLFAVVLSALIVGSLGERADSDDAARTEWAWPTEPPRGPLLQTDPSANLARYRVQHAQRLGSYGWVDRDAGIVRVPIERAMELVLERGLPAREPEDGR